MYPTLEDPSTAPVPTGPQFVFAYADQRVAVYKRHDGNWKRINVVYDGEDGIIRDTLAAVDATIRKIPDALFLLDSGDFPDTVTDFAQPSAITMLRGEVAVLRRRAEAKRRDAAYSDLRHDNGATILDARAEAIEYALSVFEKYST